jgi:WD40 repeat protein
VGTLLGVLLWPSPGSALAQRQAWSRQLAAASATTGDPALARRLAAAAYQTAPTPEASRQTLALLGAGNRPQATLTGHLDTVGALAFSPNGQLLATGSTDHTARLWDTTTRGTVRPLATLTGHLDTVEALAFSPNGQLLATGSDDHTARLWDVDPGRLVAAACATPAGRLTAPEWHRVLPHAPYQPPCG